ncbi:MAG: glycoside hydrolase family 11 protein [Lachnospiraceae bacterium]|nr:glycoside hydrolase family 11 protein [Lachnospiraceae bacterium]
MAFTACGETAVAGGDALSESATGEAASESVETASSSDEETVTAADENAETTTSASAEDNTQATGPAAGEESEGEVFTENIIGSSDDYDYELWKDNGTTKFTVMEGGTFKCEWSDINNALFRRGKKFDCTQTYKELGSVSIDYGVKYQPFGNSYMCVYGWTREPLVEYYVVQSWGSWRPPGATVSLGTVTVDGGTYDIYKTERVDQPSIDGTQTFDQYWSVRRDKPDGGAVDLSGTISLTKHFDAWEQCGLELGKMYEVALTIEGYQSSGFAEVYRNDLKIEPYTEASDIEVTVN